MLNFHKLTLDDKTSADDYFRRSAFPSNEKTFASLFDWRFMYNYEICEDDGLLYIRGYINGGTSMPESEKGRFYYIPDGLSTATELRKALLLIKDMENGAAIKLVSFSEDEKKMLEEAFCGITVAEDRNNSDYIYEREQLAELSGKKLHAKRNHINKFMAVYPDHTISELSSADYEECMKINRLWRKENDLYISDDQPLIGHEDTAIGEALKNFEALGCKGFILRVENKGIAFALGSERSPEVFVTHFEKALYEFEGSYAVINKTLAERLSGYKYINREDDVGDEGLRRAKESYGPCFMAVKYRAELV